ncbi:hypothetical protein J8J27_31655, partial [Mycobacterium tuberculosis]|nr:hypothetical protein [Mycobacterium tuberculosis]
DYAGWFDIDWHPDGPERDRKILVPFLGDHYGNVLEAGDLALTFDGGDGAFAVWAYGTHKLPVRPVDYGTILGSDSAALERLGDA